MRSLIFFSKLSSQHIKMKFSMAACVTCQIGMVMTSLQCGHDFAICQVDTWDSMVFITTSEHWKLLLSIIINSCNQL